MISSPTINYKELIMNYGQLRWLNSIGQVFTNRIVTVFH